MDLKFGLNYQIKVRKYEANIP